MVASSRATLTTPTSRTAPLPSMARGSPRSATPRRWPRSTPMPRSWTPTAASSCRASSTAHTHIYSGLARGLSIKGCNPTNFLEVLERPVVEHRPATSTLDGTRASAYATGARQPRATASPPSSTTTRASARSPAPSSRSRTSAEETGIRACLCYEVSDRRRRGEVPTSPSQENAEFAQWAAEAGLRHDRGHVRRPRHSSRISDETLDKMAEANDGLTGFHIHVCRGHERCLRQPA